MKSVVWTLVCSLFIGLNVEGRYAVGKVARPRSISFAQLFSTLTNEAETVFTTISSQVMTAENELEHFMEEYVIPAAKTLQMQSEEDFESLSKDFCDAVDSIIKDFESMENDLQNDLENFLIFDPKELLGDVQQIIRNRENKLTRIVLSLNITSDPELLIELLEDIYDYPENKNELVPLLKKNVEVIVYDKYISLSDKLRQGLKQQVAKFASSYDQFVNTDENSSVSVSEYDIFPPFINLDALVDKIFDEANFRNKELLDRILLV